MPEQDDLKNIISLFETSRTPVLMVGAGSSRISGFPLWAELMQDMQKELTPNLNLNGYSSLECADKIREQLESEGRDKEYYKFLSRTFDHKTKGLNHTDFHKTLVKLGFSGIVTTNYDMIIENAVCDAFRNRPEAIDLCEPQVYRIFDFLRSLASSSKHELILHLHGCYNEPKRIVLSDKDYRNKYGLQDSQVLDTLHRKVIWALLTMHTIVFVGFSMQDPFFMKILDIVTEDFQLQREPAHFAFIGYRDESEKEKWSSYLLSKGVRPIFYFVTLLQQPEISEDHSSLDKLIYQAARALKVIDPPISQLSKGLMDL